jgi:hypothetical protein
MNHEVLAAEPVHAGATDLDIDGRDVAQRDASCPHDAAKLDVCRTHDYGGRPQGTERRPAPEGQEHGTPHPVTGRRLSKTSDTDEREQTAVRCQHELRGSVAEPAAAPHPRRAHERSFLGNRNSK